MVSERAPLGLLVAALGAAVLAISVFQPWYGVSITPNGALSAQQELLTEAQQFGNAALQRDAHRIGVEFTGLAGRQLVTLSAHQSLGHVSLILLILAGIALLASLLRLADMRGLLYATGSQIALLGGLAVGVVLVRMLIRPGATQSILFSLSWGIWVALLSAAAILAGGLIAGSAKSHHRAAPKYGPGPPPLGRDVASPNALARPRRY